MERHAFQRDGLTLSYLDAAGAGRPLVALHSHWMEGKTYAPLASALAPEWRVVALDQRGHGYSDPAPSYTRDDYLGDIDALFRHLAIERAVLLGNSLGGVNAYAFAARAPARVAAMIIEDIGVVIADDPRMALPWRGTFATREELEARIGPRLAPYLSDSIREIAAGWRLAFEPTDMEASQRALNGDHWAEWLASDCPALVVHGRDSRVTKLAELADMAKRRPRTTLRTLEGGHTPHVDTPAGFETAIREFLRQL